MSNSVRRRQMRQHWWGTARHRHPCDRGTPAQRSVEAFFRFLLSSSTWKRHPAPFAKTERGIARRAERRFTHIQSHLFLEQEDA